MPSAVLSISLLLCLLCLVSPWCYKSYFTVTGDASTIDYSPEGFYIAITSRTQGVTYVYDTTNYVLLLKFAPPSGTARTARFSSDGLYLGVGGSDGNIYLLSGRPPFSSTPVLPTLTSGTTKYQIADIDFNLGNSKILACYTNATFYNIYSSYNGTATVAPSGSISNVIKCLFAPNEDVVWIDSNNRARSSGSMNVNGGSNFKDLALKPSSPYKAIVCGANNNAYLLTSTATTLPGQLGISPAAPLAAACYSPDGLVYAFGGGSSSERRVFLLDGGTDNLIQTFNDSSLNLLSCSFSKAGEYLLMGSAAASTGQASVFVYKKNCFDCPLGTFLTGNNTCTACELTLTSCISCTNATQCQDCAMGYYVNPTTWACSKCEVAMEGCSVCSGMSVCVECNSNYYLNSSSLCFPCHATIAGCVSCNSSAACLTCSSSHFLSGGNTCSKCLTSYANCIRCNSTQCLQCAAGFYFNGAACLICSTNCSACQNTASNCSGCSRGLYLTGNTCAPCLSNCLECNSTAFCLDCRSGSYLNGTGACVECLPGCATCNSSSFCLICLPGYYISSGVCQPCISNCSSCSSASNCSSCPLAYYLSSSFTCLSCHFLLPNCSSCNLTRCFSCEMGYYLNSSFLCSSCATAGCLVCNSSSSCQLCNNGYFLTATSSCSLCNVGCDTCQLASSNCTACVAGYYLSATSCVACGPICTTCNSTGCFTCALGYFLSSGVCQSCWGQLNGCVDCANDSVCLNCGVGRYLSGGSCLDCATGCLTCNATMCLSCDVGYFSPAANCSKCMDGCSQCTALTNCWACNVGYFYNSTKVSSQCSSCSLLSRGCTTCNSTYCFDCSPGFKLDSTTHLCLPCANVPNCEICDPTGCQLCSYGYYLTAPNCLACSLVLPGCESCSSNLVCVGCGAGYYLSGNNCVACAARCGSCNSTSCLSCALSYVWNGTLGDCVFCDSYLSDCELCANTTTCLRCSSGTYLVGGVCNPCQVALVGCAYCNTSAACVRCLEGYYLAPSGCQLCPATEGCRLCSSASNCTACNSGYVLSSTACVLCSSLLPACLSCNSSSQCALCQSGYYLNGLVCSSCSSPMPGCTLCSSSSVCTSCEGGYFLNSSSGCSACQSVGCQTCTSAAANGCVGCEAGYLLSGGGCVGCGVEGCLVCSGVGTCSVCSSGYYLLGNASCGLCSVAMVGCGRCSSAGVCVECMTLYFLSGSSCAACSVSLPGCSFCSNSSYCLSCDSGFYLNTSSLCSLCSTITGCLLCSNSSSCLYCKSGFHLINGSCSSCSSIGNCTTCYNGTLCTACLSGYTLTAAGGCEAIKVASGAAALQQVKQVKFKSQYLDKDRLKHTLQVREGKFKQADVDWSAQVKIYLENKNKSVLLTIIRGEWDTDGKSLYLITNNPISLPSKGIPFARLLIDSSLQTDLKTSLSLSQTALAAILPSLLHEGDLSVAYALTEPEFYISYLLVESPSKYFLVGLVLTAVLGLNYLIRAMCTVTVAEDHGEILGHVFAMKAVAIGLYPMFGEYVDWGFGFMTADLPWAAGRIGALLGDSSDVAAPGYLLFFTNMSVFSTFALPLLVFLILLLLVYLVIGRNVPSSFSLRSEADERLARASNKYLSVREFLFSFFQLGLVFAGCASLQGAILNPSSMLSMNGVGYIVGMMVWVGMLGETIYRCYSEWRVSRARIFIKGSLLSAVHFNPVYIVAVVLVVDLLAVIVQAKLRWDYMVAPKWWVLSNLLVNLALALLFFLPDSLLTILASSSLLCLLVLVQFYIHCLQKRIRPTEYPLFDKTTVLPSKKINPDQPREEVTWKLNLDDYSLEKCVTRSGRDKEMAFPDIQDVQDDMQETKYATTKYSQAKQGNTRDKRRNRRFNASRADSNQSWKQLQTTFNIDQK